MPAKWIEIARTGTFTDSAGREQTFTSGDLDAIARRYDPQKRDAPLCFGHPQTDKAPAFGWVDKLKSEGGRLYASFSRVPDEVRELVAKGHYRHVSMSLMPDRVSLRHVALLGAGVFLLVWETRSRYLVGLLPLILCAAARGLGALPGLRPKK